MVVHCKECGKQFNSFRGLNGHMNAHLKRMAAEPNVGATIDDTIMDAYLDEGESYDDAEIYARRAMNKIKHSAENRTISQNVPHRDIEPLENYNPVIDDEDYWEPYLEALEELYGDIGSYVDDASDSYRGIVESISLWQNVAENASSHSLDYVVNKVHKFKMDAFRYIWEEDINYVWENLSNETRDLLENFNPGSREYDGKVIFGEVNGPDGWPNLKELKDTINPRWLQQMENEPYSFDLFSAEENKYTPLSGKRRTKGRNQKWIPAARDFIRHNGKSTAAEIYPSLPDYRGAGTPVNAMALSNRLIRMPDIFTVDKSRKPYTYTLTDTKEMNAEIEIGQTYFGFDPEDEDYYHSEQYYAAESGVSTVKVYVEREDNRPWKYVTFEMPDHTIANKDNLHSAIEDRLIDILQESFGGWDLISITPVDKEDEPIDYEDSGDEPEYNWENDDFEANFNPNQPRNSAGRWVEQVEVSEMMESKPDMDVDLDELMALAVAIRLQDETFPEVDMLLEQIGDTAENRQIIFDEMIEVMSNLVNQVVTPQVETPADYYKYILDEPANDEVERIYRQANYYAQFKNSIEINGYLEELMEQYTIAKEMGATEDIIDDIERDINFVELVSRVQNMQREFQAPDWNPVQPRVPQSSCKGGQCSKPGECNSCGPGQKPGQGQGQEQGQGPNGGSGGTNPMGPPMPTRNDQDKLWVNRVDGSTWTGKNAPNEDWRIVEMIPVTQNGQQKYIRNIMDDVVKMFPPSAVVYRRNPPLLVITDMKFNIDMLANHGFKINKRELTYA